MTGVVFDTNVFVSAILFGGAPRELLLAALDGQFRLSISRPLLAELDRVLRHKFNYDPLASELLKREVVALCTLVGPGETITACRDPDDNRVLECAAAADAEYIVSGDQDLLSLHPFRGIQILSPASFRSLRPWEGR